MKSFEILRQIFSFSRTESIRYASTCPRRYKRYPIEKRNNQGERWIAQPSKDLKAVQRVLLDEYLVEILSLHKCATAYRKGSSILKNARPHLKNKFLLKMDFKDFFPSIKMVDFDYYLRTNQIIEEAEERELLGRIFFMKCGGGYELSIGSPGSPLISNALLFDFDQAVHEKCNGANITYTRYSDDMTFTTNTKDILFDLPNTIARILDDIKSPKLLINENKTVFSSKKFNRHVTGITITNDGKASLGRAKKREVRTRVYLVKNNELTIDEIWRLRGYIAFARSIEPKFVKSLWVKYPAEMTSIFSLTGDAQK